MDEYIQHDEPAKVFAGHMLVLFFEEPKPNYDSGDLRSVVFEVMVRALGLGL